MNDEHLVSLPPLCGKSSKPTTPVSGCEPIKLRFGASELELPAFLRGNKALADHMNRVQNERNKVLARIEMDSRIKSDAQKFDALLFEAPNGETQNFGALQSAASKLVAPKRCAQAAMLFAPMEYQRDGLETIVSLDFTKAS